jgi:C-terminal processing protease CtpA/Prc
MSAAEPFVFFMKSNKIAEIIGTNTAGKMLAARSFNFRKDWFLTLPVADYYAFKNIHLEQTGVSTDIEVPSDSALNNTLELIRASNDK